MSARRPNGSGRRWRRSHHPDYHRRQKRTVPQLIFTSVALVSLFVFWNEISSGTAGCFTKMTTTQHAFPPPPSEQPEEAVPDRPSVRIKLPTNAPKARPDAR